jgi:Zn-dependent protease
MQNLDRFSTQAREVLRQAQSEAARLHHAEVSPEHIAIALGSHQRSMSLAILRDLNVAIPRIQNQLRESIGRGKLAARQLATFSPRFQRVVDLAVSEAKVFGDREIGTQHLLLGVIREGGDAKSVLANHGVSLYGVHKLMRGLGIHDGDSLPAVDLNQTPIMKSGVVRAVRAVPIRPSRVFLGLLGFVALMGLIVFLNPPIPKLFMILFVLSGWIVKVCIHEFGHASIAYLGGDSTVVNKGYLTLNPLRYTNRLLSIILPVLFLLIGGIGLPGGCVYIDRYMIRSRRMLSLMSAGGILAQLALILLMLIPYHILMPFTRADHALFWGGYSFLLFLSIYSSFINLIPIPGVDGYGILEPYLPIRITNFAEKIRPYGFLVFYLILLTPNPISMGVVWAATGLASLLGIDFGLIGTGSSMFRIF